MLIYLYVNSAFRINFIQVLSKKYLGAECRLNQKGQNNKKNSRAFIERGMVREL